MSGESSATPNEPIAVIGIGCRFPGGASSPAKLWELLCGGFDAITDVPPDRWDTRRFYHPDSDRPGKMYTRQAGFLKEDIFGFDPLFFGISPREAPDVDPQQRLLLEVTWEAVEDAGIPAEKLNGSNTGVFIGGFCMDHMFSQFSVLNRDLINSFSGTGTTMTMLAGRISYVYNLIGPSVSMDTACSSSLVAAHYACRSIWNGECDQAIAGGVNVMSRPEFFIGLCKGRFLSEHCRCSTFDEQAGGYVRGEGAGVVILKPLSRALADNDRIYALIRSSGVNQDGQTAGITVPNPDSQEALINKVCAGAGVSPCDIYYVEAHGTGTQVGDQAETAALHRVLSRGRRPGDKCLIGSVKTNIGHLEAGAGVAGLIKAALCLKNKKIPPNLHFNRPNPQIPFEQLCLRVPTELEPWPPVKDRVYAGVNSFGFGGTNAHVLLEAPPVEEAGRTAGHRRTPDGKPVLVPVTARDQKALRQLAADYADYLLAEPRGKTVSLEDFAYTAAFRRSHHHHRLAVAAQSGEHLCRSLRMFAGGDEPAGLRYSRVLPPEARKLVYVCTGMGPQWWAMGRELLEKEPVFRNTVEQCDAAFKKHSGWSLLAELKRDEKESRIGETQVAQPAGFAIQAALAALLKSWGITPDAVVGHSVGEIAAAYISGALSLEDALLVAYHRSRLQQTVAGKGSMLAVGLSEDEARVLIEDYKNVSLAAINSGSAVTLAGETAALREISSVLENNCVFNRFLHVEVAYHSYQMDVLRDQLINSLSSLSPGEACIPLYSTVTGQRINGPELDGNYWWRNVRQPVRFGRAVRTLRQDGYGVFMEIGPHPVLAGSIRETLSEAGAAGQVVSTLRRKQPELETMLDSLGLLYTLGFTVNWEVLVPYARYTPLPGYPWQRERYIKESEESREDRLGLPGHVFLNSRAGALNPAWQAELNDLYFDYLKDHCIEHSVVFPAAGYIEAGLAINRSLTGNTNCILTGLSFRQVLVVSEKETRQVCFNYDPKTREYSVLSSGSDREEPWRLYAAGHIRPAATDDLPEKFDLDSLKKRCREEIPREEFYRMLDGCGLNYGPSFRTLREIYRGSGEALALVELVHSTTDGDYLLHPTVLDGCIQATLAALEELKDTFVPVSVERLTLYTVPGPRVWSFCRITERSKGSLKGDLLLLDDQGNVVVSVRSLTCRAIAPADRSEENPVKDLLYQLSWQKTADIPDTPPANKTPGWLIFGDNSEDTGLLTDCLAANGIDQTLVFPGESYRKAGREYCISPDDPDHIRMLFKDTAGSNLSNVLYLWGLRQGSEAAGDLFVESVGHCARLARIIKSLSDSRPGLKVSLCVITRGAQAVVEGETVANLAASPLWGLGFLAGNEYPDIRCRLIDLDRDMRLDDMPAVVRELISGGDDTDIALRSSGRYIKQLLPAGELLTDETPETRTVSTRNPVRLEAQSPGRIDSLVYRRFDLAPPGPGEIQIEVHTCGLNYKDLLKVLNQIPPEVIEGTYFENEMGMESAGKVVAVGEGVSELAVGDEVIGFARGFCSYANLPAEMAVKKPAGLSFEESLVLTGFGTAYHGLVNVAGLQQDERILIHNATGGVGLAAVQVAKWVGAEIFATAGSEEKREYLRSIGIKHVMNSRTLKFADDIRTLTGSRGVDVVINAIAGDAMLESFSLLAPFGRFIEIGKRDIAENSGLPMRAFNKNLTFSALDMDRLLKERPRLVNRVLQKITGLFDQGQVCAIPARVFPAAEAAEAFRLMAQSGHIGKIVLDMRGQEVLAISSRQKENRFHREATYLITGGTSGFGLEIARWMSERGAGNIVMVSRSGASEETRLAVAKVEQNGARVEIWPVDVADETQVKLLLERIKKNLPPLKGIFHGAMVLDDGYLGDLDQGRFARVMAPKIRGALYLHQFTEGQPLDFFISFSSISTLIGNPGQGNYVAANTFLDAFAHYRRSRGLPATTINLGVLSETGVAARHGGFDRVFESSGIHGFSTSQALQGLEEILGMDAAQIGFFDVDWSRFTDVYPRAAGSSRFQRLVRGAEKAQKLDKKQLLVDRLSPLGLAGRQRLMELLVRETLAGVLRLPAERIPVEQNLIALGVDSLMALELKHSVKDGLGIEISTIELLKGPSTAQMAKKLLDALDLPLSPNHEERAADTGPEMEQSLIKLMKGVRDE